MNSILVVDHVVIREGIKTITSDLDVRVYEAENTQQAMQLLRKKRYDLAIMDIDLHDTEPLAFLQNVLLAFPKQKVLIFSMHPERIYGKRVLSLGGKGFLTKRASAVAIRQAIVKVLQGEVFMTEDLKDELASSFISRSPVHELDSLSDRELEVLLLLVTGVRLKDISNKLNLQMSTVSTYKRRIFEKLEVENVIELLKKVSLYGAG